VAVAKVEALLEAAGIEKPDLIKMLANAAAGTKYTNCRSN
jgi:hypothetical protein